MYNLDTNSLFALKNQTSSLSNFWYIAYINNISNVDWCQLRFYSINNYDTTLYLFRTKILHYDLFKVQFGNRIIALYSKQRNKKYFFTSEIFQEDLIDLETALEDIHVSFFGFFIKNTAFLFDNVNMYEPISLICFLETLSSMCFNWNNTLSILSSSIYRNYYVNMYLKSIITFYIIGIIFKFKG